MNMNIGAIVLSITLGCISLQAVNQEKSAVAASSRKTTVAAAIVPPVTYSGVLPCVACAGRRFTLSLRADNLFLLRQVYLSDEKEKGKDKTLVEQGTWSSSPDGSRIILSGGVEGQRQFAIRDPDTLRLLDDRGREIPSTLNYDVVRSKTFDPIEEPFRKGWMVERNVNRSFAIDCIKGMRFPIAQEADFAGLEAAYKTAQPAENAPLVVEFEGHFARRPKSPGTGEEEVVVVNKFLQVRPGESCTGSLPVGGLENTYWKLVELNGAAIVAGAGQQEPHLRLESVLRRVTVSGGCSSMRGSYQVNQGGLRFTQLDGDTQKECPKPIMDQETALLKALAETSTFRLFTEALELYGQGKQLARFEKQEKQK